MENTVKQGIQPPKQNKKRRIYSFIVILGIIATISIALYFKSKADIVVGFPIEYDLGEGIKVNFNSDWNATVNDQLGLHLSSLNKSIYFTLSKVSSAYTIETLINERILKLPEASRIFEISDVEINGYKFKKIEQKTESELIQPDKLIFYASIIPDNNYLLITISASPKDDLGNVERIVRTVRK